MRSDENWDSMYSTVMQFMCRNKRRPSRHRIEDVKMLNWVKFNKRCFRNGTLPPHRKERFEQLLEVAQAVQRVNQYSFCNPDSALLTPPDTIN